MTAHEEVEVLREELEDQERELHSAVGDLEAAARETFQPGRWIQRRPFAALGVAFVFGWWIGCR